MSIGYWGCDHKRNRETLVCLWFPGSRHSLLLSLTHFLHCHLPHYDTISFCHTIPHSAPVERSLSHNYAATGSKSLAHHQNYAQLFFRVTMTATTNLVNTNLIHKITWQTDCPNAWLTLLTCLDHHTLVKIKGLWSWDLSVWHPIKSIPRWENIQTSRRNTSSHGANLPQLPGSTESTPLRTAFFIWITIFTCVYIYDFFVSLEFELQNWNRARHMFLHPLGSGRGSHMFLHPLGSVLSVWSCLLPMRMTLRIEAGTIRNNCCLNLLKLCENSMFYL